MRIKNYGQIARKVKIKKRLSRSQFTLNLSVEAGKWAKLRQIFISKINNLGDV